MTMTGRIAPYYSLLFFFLQRSPSNLVRTGETGETVTNLRSKYLFVPSREAGWLDTRTLAL